MGGGWLRNPQDGWTYRFQRDEKSWLQDPFVFVDKGRAMPDGSPALLKKPVSTFVGSRQRACGGICFVVDGRRFLLLGDLNSQIPER